MRSAKDVRSRPPSRIATRLLVLAGVGVIFRSTQSTFVFLRDRGRPARYRCAAGSRKFSAARTGCPSGQPRNRSIVLPVPRDRAFSPSAGPPVPRTTARGPMAATTFRSATSGRRHDHLSDPAADAVWAGGPAREIHPVGATVFLGNQPLAPPQQFVAVEGLRPRQAPGTEGPHAAQ